MPAAWANGSLFWYTVPDSWLKKLFPGFTEEKYEMLRYAGTEDSPVFKDELTKPEQGFYKKFLSDQGIIVDAKAK